MMLGNAKEIRKREAENSWQELCYQAALWELNLSYERLQPVRRLSCKTSSSALANWCARSLSSGFGVSSRRFSK